jgi:hypothetical protein
LKVVSSEVVKLPRAPSSATGVSVSTSAGFSSLNQSDASAADFLEDAPTRHGFDGLVLSRKDGLRLSSARMNLRKLHETPATPSLAREQQRVKPRRRWRVSSSAEETGPISSGAAVRCTRASPARFDPADEVIVESHVVVSARVEDRRRRDFETPGAPGPQAAFPALAGSRLSSCSSRAIGVT